MIDQGASLYVTHFCFRKAACASWLVAFLAKEDQFVLQVT